MFRGKMMSWGAVTVGLSCAWLLAACGNVAEDNVEACEAYNEKLNASFNACVNDGGGTSVHLNQQCHLYERYTTCDVSEYFECLEANTSCTDGMLDITGHVSCSVPAC